MHLDLTAPDRLFTNFINYQKKNRVIIDKKIKSGHSTWFHQNRNQGLHTLESWCYSSSVGWNHFTQQGLGTEKPSAIKGVRAIKFINSTEKTSGSSHSTCTRSHRCFTPITQHHISEAFPKNTSRTIPLFLAQEQKAAHWSPPTSPLFAFFLN